MPSIQKNSFLLDQSVITLGDQKIIIDFYNTPLGERFLEALQNNLQNKRILEKNFCFLGWPDHKRNLSKLCDELNLAVFQINAFNSANHWQVAGLGSYPKIDYFTPNDFQYGKEFKVGKSINGDISLTLGKRLKHESCNLLHRHFEELQGSAWKLSEYYKKADFKTRYAIRQLNNLCHEIEAYVLADRKQAVEPEWIRPAQITTFLNAPRHDLHEEDYDLFKQNRYNRELGGVYLHWSQVGKTLYEVYRDEDAPVMTEAMCSEINHQKYYTGEFDIEWGNTITEDTHDFKLKEMDGFRNWLKQHHYNWEDPKLALGYIKIGQVDLIKSFGTNNFLEVFTIMTKNLNISTIEIDGKYKAKCDYPYSLDSDNWKDIQIEYLKAGYESRSMR